MGGRFFACLDYCLGPPHPEPMIFGIRCIFIPHGNEYIA